MTTSQCIDDDSNIFIQVSYKSPRKPCSSIVINKSITDSENALIDALTYYIQMTADPNYIFDVSSSSSTIILTFTDNGILIVNLSTSEVTYTPFGGSLVVIPLIIVGNISTGTFIDSGGNNVTIIKYPSYFTLTFNGIGLIYNSNTNTILPV